MNKPNVKLTMTGNTRERLKEAAKSCGYGPKETNKFINRMLDIVQDFSAMFTKTK